MNPHSQGMETVLPGGGGLGGGLRVGMLAAETWRFLRNRVTARVAPFVSRIMWVPFSFEHPPTPTTATTIRYAERALRAREVAMAGAGGNRGGYEDSCGARTGGLSGTE